MEVVQETSPYVNITSPDKEYEEIQLKERKLDIEHQEESQQGSQVELTSKTRNRHTKKSQLYSSVESSKKVETSGFSDGAAYTVRLSSKCVVILAMVAIFFVILALVLSALAVITVMTANPNTSRDCEERSAKNDQDLKGNVSALQELLAQEIKRQWSQFKKSKEETKVRFSIVWNNIKDLTSSLGTMSDKLNVTEQKMQDSDQTILDRLASVNATLTNQVETVSKMPGPIGPPGYNGSQGLNGSQGPAGPSGPKGAGNISQCHYKFTKSSGTSSGPAVIADVIAVESSGTRIVGATCSTDDAKEYRLSSGIVKSGKYAGKTFYKCRCAGQSDIMKDGGGKMKCFIHYWECPLIS